ncbi:hypothetical protein [Oceanimonas baumannii]|uniref:hypothetical protein n=1 Tax=Oceanimonas baumannii TaxID=129578 RepID=UPI003A9441CD
MDFVTSAILGGALYDLVSSKVKLNASYIKAGLDNIVNLEEKVASLVAEELSKAEYRKTASREELSAMIESSPTLQKVITQLNEKSQRVVNINAFGDGDAFYGDKVLGDKITYNDN